MKRLLLIVVFGLAIVASAYAQAQSEGGAEQEVAAQQRVVLWKWLNFGILVAGLGYLVVKNAPAFFNARSEEIQKAIKDATGLKVEADFRSSEMDRRMATLSAEIAKLREHAKVEMERESKRVDEDTRVSLARIQEHTTREIESLRIQAGLAVREHAVRLASDLAVSHLRDNPGEVRQDELIHIFTGDVLKGAR
jgi:F0F1-type ATP synthase membrane subunit b/b'